MKNMNNSLKLRMHKAEDVFLIQCSKTLHLARECIKNLPSAKVRTILLSVLLPCCLNVSGQITFDKGYIIGNSGVKIECLIKNYDWRVIPKTIQYCLSEDSPVITASIDSLMEFKVDNYSRFVRATVKIDRSPIALESLSTTKEPQWSEETLLLRELTCGKACLWSYTEDRSWFFYSLDNSVPEQLVYKRYHVTENKTLRGERMIYENAGFRQQLYTYLQNENTKDVNLKNLVYKEIPLVKYFKRYNADQENAQTDVARLEREALNIKITGSLNYSWLNVSNGIKDNIGYDFGGKPNWMAGLELEYFPPFNRNRFSILFAPTFEHYQNSKIFDDVLRSIKMISVRFPVGGRCNLYLNDDMKFFFDLYYNYFICINKNEGFTIVGRTLDIKEADNWIVGGGFAYKKWQVELQYHTIRDLFSEYSAWGSDYTKAALSVSYKIVSIKK